VKLLRETIRKVLETEIIKENKLAVDSETIWPKIEAWMEDQCMQAGLSIEYFETDFPTENKFEGMWTTSGSPEKGPKILEDFEKWFRNRGWNVLASRWEENGNLGRLSIHCDKQANPKSSNRKWTLTELGNEEYVLFHVTPKKNWPRIRRKGFIPRSQSSDGIRYGAQRNFFFTMPYDDWVDYEDSVIGWFSKMFSNDQRGKTAGLSEDEDLILIALQTYPYAQRRIAANFYIDTEFGFGTGAAQTRGLGFDMEAIYTPSHIPMIPYGVATYDL
jgi:hypothetical protein